MVYRTLKEILSPIVRVLWVGKIEGKEHLPKKGAAILASNHQSFLDAPLMMTISRRRIYFLVGDFVYRSKLGAWLMNVTNQIKVDRTQPSGNEHVYEQSAKVLERGHLLSIFPEGWMSKDGKTQKAYRGVARIALQNKVDIIPIVFDGSYHIFPYNSSKPVLGKKCRIVILEPIKYSKIKNLTTAQIVHDLLMPKIAKELGHEYEHRDLAKQLAE
jgi:1-acyl-sn-glycerol-3-phosphate acyltransferase